MADWYHETGNLLTDKTVEATVMAVIAIVDKSRSVVKKVDNLYRERQKLAILIYIIINFEAEDKQCRVHISTNESYLLTLISNNNDNHDWRVLWPF